MLFGALGWSKDDVLVETHVNEDGGDEFADYQVRTASTDSCRTLCVLGGRMAWETEGYLCPSSIGSKESAGDVGRAQLQPSKADPCEPPGGELIDAFSAIRASIAAVQTASDKSLYADPWASLDRPCPRRWSSTLMTRGRGTRITN